MFLVVVNVVCIQELIIDGDAGIDAGDSSWQDDILDYFVWPVNCLGDINSL